MKDRNLPIEVLRATFLADLAAGRIWWRERPVDHFLIERDAIATNKKKAGKEAGEPRYKNGRAVRFRYRGELIRTLVHRVVFALAHNRWPSGEIDHIHGGEAGDGIDNLRDGTHQENLQNQSAQRKNAAKSGFTGVSLDKRRLSKPWTSKISVHGKVLNLGYFSTSEEASQVYLEARRKYFTVSPEMR